MKKYDTYKDSGIEWIGEIPSHWEVNKVKHVFDFQTGFTPPSGKTEYYENGNHIWINISDLQEKYIDDSANKITDKAIEDFNPEIVPQGSLLYSFKLSVGKVGFNTKDCYTNEAIFSIKSDENMNLSFFYYSLPDQIIKNANKNIYGAKILNQELIKNAHLIIPPTSEQSLIADYLDRKTAEIDELIVDKEKLIELYEEEKTAIINELVTGKIVWNGNAWVEPSEVKDSGVEWLGEIPEHWEVKRLKYVGESIMGIIYSPKEIVPKKNNSLLVLRASNIQNGKFSYNDSVYVETKVNEKQILRKNDILICSRSGSASLIGKNILIDERIAGQTFGAFMTVFRTNLARFVYFYFNSQIFRALTALFSTSTINQLTISTLNNFVIAIPPLPEQTTIVQHIESESARIDAKIANAKKLIDLLKEYRTALISEVVTGKIKVVD